MKLNIRHLPIVGVLALAAVGAGSCTDKIAFGNAFLEKAPGGTTTADTVFSNAEYTRYFLNQMYAYQYYNLPTGSTNNTPQYYNYFKGMPDILADTHHACTASPSLVSWYYNGMVTSAADGNGNYNVFPYNNMHIWENVRAGNIMLERIENVPGMDDAEKARIADETRCLMAYSYFQMFRFYGGLPIVDKAYVGDEVEYPGRKSAQETIDFMLSLLDTAIEGNHMPWAYDGDDAVEKTGHWTLAGAHALKIQILQFAASPLLNSEKPYYEGKYTMEHPEFVWLGGYDAARWTALKNACDKFFQEMNARGHYHLVVPGGDTQEDYAFAFRSSYMLQNSPEIIHSVRVSSTANDNSYRWFMLAFASKSGPENGTGANERLAYCPTQEYVEMFPWADGTPFDWNKTKAEGKLGEMFIKGTKVDGQHDLQDVKYTRDPRLYENVAVNGQRCVIEWNSGSRSGEPYEGYVGGTVAKQQPKTGQGFWGTGYRMLTYVSGFAFLRNWPQWSPLRLSDMYLTYAEAILQSGGSLTEAIKYVDAVRARVGMKGLVECNPAKNLTSDKDALLEEIMRERACELAFQMSRYFDLIRYKRADLFEKKLHGLRMYRMVDGQRDETMWWDGDRKNTAITQSNPRFYEPTDFEYEIFEITNNARIWWTQGFDPKYYFQAFPITEVNKNYGLDQNPGW